MQHHLVLEITAEGFIGFIWVYIQIRLQCSINDTNSLFVWYYLDCTRDTLKMFQFSYG